MKKITLLIISIILISGCYDYIELNELSIISMITIDKINDEYNLTFELLNDRTKGEKDNTNKSIIISAKGSTIASAIADGSSKIPKKAYFAHLKVLVISKSIAKTDLKSIVEYFLRSPNIRNEFYLVLIDNIKIDDIYATQSEENPVVSEYITSMLKDNQKSYNNVTNNNFENIIIDVFTKGKDAVIPVIKIENNNLKASGSGLLKKYTLKEILSSKESNLLNILKNNSLNTLFTYKCPNSDKKITFSIYSGKTKIDSKNITIDIMSEIEEYNCQEDLKDVNTFKKFNNYYEKQFQKDIFELYHKMQIARTDSLGIGKSIYNKNNKYQVDDWFRINPRIKVSLKINKEGLIYEVNNG